MRRPVVDELDRTKQSFLDAVALGAFTVPGDGSLDFGAIVQRFADYGYEGWFVVEAEQDPRKNPPLKMAQVGHKELMRVMTRRRLHGRDAGVSVVSLRLKRPADGHIVVTPESAGWTYVGFEVDTLEPGKSAHDNTGDRELCLVFVTGKGRRHSGRQRFRRARRADESVRQGRRPRSMSQRTPTGASPRRRRSTLAGCTAPGGGDYPARIIDIPPQITRGRGSNTRYVTNILPEDRAGAFAAGGRGDHAGRQHLVVPAAQARHRQPAARVAARGDVLPSPQPAAGLCHAARLYRRPHRSTSRWRSRTAT